MKTLLKSLLASARRARCSHRHTAILAGEVHCNDCGQVQMVMQAPSGRMLVMWVRP